MNPDKTVHAANVPTSTERPRRQFPREEIARCAEQLWAQRGRPSGQDEAIWLEAESQLEAQAESRPVSGTDSRPLVDEPAKTSKGTKSPDASNTGVQTRSATDAQSKQTAGHLRDQ